MTKVTVTIMSRKVSEHETEKEITLESILTGVKSFKKDMDKLGYLPKKEVIPRR